MYPTAALLSQARKPNCSYVTGWRRRVGEFLLDKLKSEGIDVSRFEQRPELQTSATAVLMNDRMEHIFAYKPGASEAIDRHMIDDHLEFISRSKFLLLGYYALLPNLEPVLSDVLQTIQNTGCQTALDYAGWRRTQPS